MSENIFSSINLNFKKNLILEKIITNNKSLKYCRLIKKNKVNVKFFR